MSNFKDYLECELIFEIKINTKDPDIRKIRKGFWEINFKENIYHFIAEPITLLDNTKGFMINWGLLKDNGELTTDIVGDVKNMIEIFSKIGSCMALFINDEHPNGFVMYVNKRLSRIYDTMWGKHHSDKPFKDYFFRDRKKYGKDMYVFHYYKKSDDYMNESQWLEILGINGIKS